MKYIYLVVIDETVFHTNIPSDVTIINDSIGTINTAINEGDDEDGLQHYL